MDLQNGTANCSVSWGTRWPVFFGTAIETDRGFDYRWGHWNFYILFIIPSHSTMAVASNQPLTEVGKSKAVPIQAWSGPEGSSKLRFPEFMTTAQEGGKLVRLTHRPPLPPGNATGTHFC